MRRSAQRFIVVCILGLLLVGAPLLGQSDDEQGGEAVEAASDEAAADAEIELKLQPLVGTIGQALELTLTVNGPVGSVVTSGAIGPRLGPFTVLDGAWRPDETPGSGKWHWSGTVAAYKTGELEFPAVRVTLTQSGETSRISSKPLRVTIESVLGAEETESTDSELADLKPPASIEADYGPVRTALALLAALLLLTGLVWWLHRRFAAKLAAAPREPALFDRIPPHEWVYAELQQLLDRRLPEQGQVDLFFEELARILKQYLGGRYRLDLLEHTTDEVGNLLDQAGAPQSPTEDTLRLLESCDRVKFARERPLPDACRAAVERAYDIVDRTRPADARQSAARSGAA